MKGNETEHDKLSNIKMGIEKFANGNRKEPTNERHNCKQNNERDEMIQR